MLHDTGECETDEIDYSKNGKNCGLNSDNANESDVIMMTMRTVMENYDNENYNYDDDENDSIKRSDDRPMVNDNNNDYYEDDGNNSNKRSDDRPNGDDDNNNNNDNNNYDDDDNNNNKKV